MKSLIKKLLVEGSTALTIVFIILAGIGIYVSKDIELQLSLSDLLPQDHPTVIKFNKLTQIIGGVGYVEIVLHAEDKNSHLQVAPDLVSRLRQSTLVRSAFFEREESFFLSRVLYYADLEKLKDLEINVDKGVVQAKRKLFDIGLWDDEATTDGVKLDPELKSIAERAARLPPNLISKDEKDLLIMVKPSFDSLDMNKSRQLIQFTEQTLSAAVPRGVTFRLSGRYYSKVKDAQVIEADINILGILANVIMALILYLYFRSVRAVISIFIPVILGLGITALLTRIFIGHINLITGFLVGILAGVGTDYGIHLLWRIRVEQREPSSSDPDPLWRTLKTCGWANVVTIVSTGICFFMMCGSSFKIFSEFGFICGMGLTWILITKMGSFHCTSKWLSLEKIVARDRYPFGDWKFPLLRSRPLFLGSIAIIVILIVGAGRVGFEFDFEKMMEHSREIRETSRLVDAIYDRSTVPSAFATSTRQEALDVEKYMKDKYSPDIISSIVSGASIVPENQPEKQQILKRIDALIRPVRDSQITESVGISGSSIRTWVKADPFHWEQLPIYLQEALRGTQQAGYLLYFYPTEHLDNAQAVDRFASMIRDVEKRYPNLVSGSDALIFSDILGLILRDGVVLFILIIVFVGVFIGILLRNMKQALLCYVPFLISLPLTVGLMAVLHVRFNIFNVALLPALVAVGIEIPIQLMQRSREIGSGFKGVRDIAVSLHLALITTLIGFGVLVFTRAGVLKSMGWISIIGIFSIWIVGLFLHPAILERYFKKEERTIQSVPSAVAKFSD